tara:strand:- start:360 stop:479 length:120 start_codon:yes stop_codon:yes gene_type:complete
MPKKIRVPVIVDPLAVSLTPAAITPAVEVAAFDLASGAF